MLSAVALFLLVLVIYSNALRGGFLYDDEFLIQKNRIVQNIELFPQAFVTSTTEGSGGKDSFYRPMQIVAYSLIDLGFGLDPFWFHFLNVIIHGLNVILVFLLFTSLFMHWGLKKEYGLFVALLWAAHPIHTEAVAYISATADPLHFFFGLLFLLTGIKPKRKWQILSLVFLILALLTKEASVTFPALLFAARLSLHPTDYKKALKASLPALGIAAGYILLRKTWLDFDDSFVFYTSENIYTNSVLNRLYTGFAALTKYLELLIWPDHLQIDRSFPVYTSLFSLKVLIGATLTALSLVPLFKFKTISPWWLFAALWFWGYHILHMGVLLPLNSLFLEHWMYVPSLALISIFVVLLFKIFERINLKTVAVLLVLASTAALALRTHRQNAVWNNPISLYTHILKGSPQIARVHNNLAMAYSDKNQFDKAKEHYLKSIEIDDSYPQVRHNLGLLYLRQNQVDKGIFQLKRALEINPGFFHSHLYLSKAYEFKGESELARHHLQKFNELSPQFFTPPESEP